MPSTTAIGNVPVSPTGFPACASPGRVGRFFPFLWNALGLGLILMALASGCAGPRGLVQRAEPGFVHWADDGAPAALEAAVEQSIRYYAGLPTDTEFRYAEETYTPAEMIRSMELFRALWLKTSGGEALTAGLREKFHLFESVALEGKNLFTGYYEPVIPGSPNPDGKLDTAVYARPPNLVEIDLSRFGDSLPNRKLVGRVEDGQVVPYFSRKEIQQGKALKGQLEPLAYVNEVDLFFLQIQGSGIIQMPDGLELRVGYEAKNGHPYRSIGALLIRRELMTREEVSMQAIRQYLEQNQHLARSVLFSNPSYVFFRLLEEGPLGNIQVPLTPGRSLAVDHRIFPKGGLVYLRTEVPLFGDVTATRPFRRFMLVQDTGGAIRGHGRGDIFFGRGPIPEWTAGHLKHPGNLFLLVARKEFIKPPVPPWPVSPPTPPQAQPSTN